MVADGDADDSTEFAPYVSSSCHTTCHTSEPVAELLQMASLEFINRLEASAVRVQREGHNRRETLRVA